MFIFSHSTYIPWSLMFESGEDLIVRRIKEFVKSKEFIGTPLFYIMLRNRHILFTGDYYNMVKASKINPQDAYVYFKLEWSISKPGFHYPFINTFTALLDAYLSKLGFHYSFLAVPATGLKYVAFGAVAFDIPGFYGNYFKIEVSDLDTVVSNTDLPKVVFEVLGEKLVSREKELTKEEYEKIEHMFESQRLFAGHDFEEAWKIIHDYYYNKGNTSLAKEAARIAMEYDRIFNPYTVCYDMETWEEVDCSSIR